MKIILSRQTRLNECGLACLRMICVYYGMNGIISDDRIARHITPKGVSISALLEIAQEMGLDCEARQGSFEEFLAEAKLPCIVFWRNAHFVVVYQITAKTVKFADPAIGFQELEYKWFQANWLQGFDNQGIAIFCRPQVAKEID